MKKIIYLFFTLLLVSGCATAYRANQYSQTQQLIPINVSQKNFPVFAIIKIKSALLPDSVIGRVYDTCVKMIVQTYYTSGVVGDLIQDQYINGIREELENAGYNVSGGAAELFEDDDAWKARFLIGGRIIKVECNRFSPGAGDFSEDGVTINWEVYDKQSRKIIYKISTDGYVKWKHLSSKDWIVPVTNVPPSIVRNAFRNLLAKNEFVNAIEQCLNNPPLESSELNAARFSKNRHWVNGKMSIDEVNNAIIAIKTENGHGTGFIINSDGYAVTNYHVVANNNVIEALLKGGKPIQAQVIKTSPEKDLALIKLRGEEYDYLPLTDLSSVRIGMDVYAVGTPADLSLANSLSKGVVSGIRKRKDFNVTLLQTDASVSPGNSGGPLINMKGEVIGVVALKIAIPGFEGLGFAISVDDVKKYLFLHEENN